MTFKSIESNVVGTDEFGRLIARNGIIVGGDLRGNNSALHLGRKAQEELPNSTTVPEGTTATVYGVAAQDMGWVVNSGIWVPANGFKPQVVYVDDFKRPDTSLGSIGGGWTLTGNGVSQARVAGGKYVLPQTDPINVRTVYASRLLPFSPTYLAARFNWKSNGGTSGIRKTLALLMPKRTVLGDVLESVHATLATQVATQILAADGAFIDIASLYNPPSGAIAADGSTHLFEVFVYGALVVTRLDGIVAGYAYAPATVLPVLPTRQIMVEHYSASGVDIQYELEVNSVAAGYSS